MKKLFKKLALMVVALLTFSVGSNYTVKEVKAASGSYVKVTEAPTDWSGDYLIVYEAGNVAFKGSLTTLDAANNNFAVTITGGKIDATDEVNNNKFTIAKSGDLYTIKSASGYFIGNTSDANKLLSNKSTQYTNTISLNDDDSVQIVGSGKSVLRYNANSGNYRFRYFKSSTYSQQKAISLFKFVESTFGGETPEPEEPILPETTISISGNTYTEVGKSVSLTPNVTNFEGNVVWSSSNTKVATVDQTGKVTAFTMGETTITATAGDKVAEHLFKVYPENDSTLTIAEALAVCDLTGTTETAYKYYLQGNITELKNATYGNVVIEDATGSILIYGLYKDGVRYDNLDLKPIVNDTIKVYGTLVNYNNSTPEMSGKPELIEHTANSTNQELIEMVETTASLGFDYTYDEVETTKLVPATEATLTFDDKAKRTDYSTEKQVWSENGVTFTNEKGSSTTNVGDYANPVRAYKNSVITIEVDGPISKIIFDSVLDDGTTGNKLYLTQLKASIEDYNYEVDSNKANLIICNLDKSSNEFKFTAAGQVRFNSITVFYGDDTEVTTTTKDFTNSKFDDISILFGAEVDASLFEDFTKVTAGVMFSTGNELKADTAKKYPVETLVETDGVYSVGAVLEVFAEGDIVNDDTKGKLSQNITAAVYFVVDGETLVLASKTVSVASMIETYLGMCETNNDIKNHEEALKALKAYIEA